MDFGWRLEKLGYQGFGEGTLAPVGLYAINFPNSGTSEYSFVMIDNFLVKNILPKNGYITL